MKAIGIMALAVATSLTLACNRTNNAGRNEVGTGTSEIGTSGTAGSGISSSDKSWVEDMATDGMAEVELGNLAKDHASSADVKQFADMMVRDHGKAGDELKSIAEENGIAMPSQLDQKHRDLVDKLSKLRGNQFDKEYMNAMVDGHQDAIGSLEKKADVDRFGQNKGTVTPEKTSNPVDARLNQWAANTLPTVQHHLDEAKRIKDSLNNRPNTTY